MENSKNRWFYTSANHSKEELIDLHKKKLTMVFRIRINMDDVPLMRTMKDWDMDYVVNKADNAGARDGVEQYEWDIMEYDNSKAVEMYIGHSVCVCHMDDIDDFKKEMEKVSNDITYRKTSSKTITTHINVKKEVRGIWIEDLNSSRTPKYPICILTLSRANDNGKTHIYLSECKIKHYLFVEPRQLKQYEEWYNPEYCEIVSTGRNFSQADKMGSTPVRNFILDWVYKFKCMDRAWMLDDNIKDYVRYLQGKKNKIYSSQIFTSIEDYIERYTNVGIVSHNFGPLTRENDARTIIVENGKCYSSMLVPTTNDIRFRYKHQEDNLISMEYISKGYTTLCFNHIQYNKDTSGINTGGNHEEIYKVKEGQTDGDGYKERYEYFECILKILLIEGKLKLLEGKTLEDLLKRATPDQMKSKTYHAKVNYKVIEGCDNSMVKKVKHKPKPQNLELIFKPNVD